MTTANRRGERATVPLRRGAEMLGARRSAQVLDSLEVLSEYSPSSFHARLAVMALAGRHPAVEPGSDQLLGITLNS